VKPRTSPQEGCLEKMVTSRRQSLDTKEEEEEVVQPLRNFEGRLHGRSPIYYGCVRRSHIHYSCHRSQSTLR
jgi:hypothetical protein